MIPSDQPTREKVIHDLETTFSVQAGAGTGKTFLLTTRYLEIVKKRLAKPHEIVTITFTEKAAGELRERIQKRLEEKGDKELLLDLDRAPISTIHSLATSIIRERPLQAEIDPNFEQMDEISSQIFVQEMYEKWLSLALRQEGQPFILATAAAIKPSQIKDLAFTLYQNRDLLNQLDLTPPKLEFSEAFQSIYEKIRSLSEFSERFCKNTNDAGFLQIQQLRKEISESLDLTEEGKIRALLLRTNVKKGKGSQQNWESKDSCQNMKEKVQELALQVEETKEKLRRKIFLQLLDWLLGFVAFVEKEKNVRGCLDFDDLLLRALSLFKKHPMILDSFRSKYKYILVDEFQDTDPVQSELVWLLAGASGDRSIWTDLDIPKGRLFVVGDPQQSIYRFRKADINTYRTSVEKLSPAVISQNFRASSHLIDGVNQLFSTVFPSNYQPLSPDASRPKPKLNASFIRIEPSISEGKYSTRQRRRQESQAIAGFIHHVITHPSFQLYDRDQKVFRPYNYGDFVVLFPTMTDVDFFEEQLRQFHIPFSLEGGKNFYGRWEIHGLLSILYAIEHPTDRIAVVAALRSILLGFSDQALVDWIQECDSFDYRSINGDLFSPEAKEALELFQTLHQSKNEKKPSELIRSVLTFTRAIPITLLRFHGEQAAANLQKMISLAQELESREVMTLGRFIRWIESRSEEAEKQGESPLSESGENVVHLMTIHKAKGLEFPCVILANLASQPNIREQVIADRLTHRLEIGIGDKKNRACTSGYEEALEKEKTEIQEEKARLLYVAMTRACDLLVLPKFLPDRGKPFFWNLLEEAWKESIPCQTFTEEDFSLKAPDGPLTEHFQDFEENAPERFQSLQEVHEWTHRRQETWVQGISLGTATGEKTFAEHPSRDFIPRLREIPATQMGSVFHQTMEHFPWQQEHLLEQTLQQISLENGIHDYLEELQNLVSQTLTHPVMSRAKGAKNLWKEVPFSRHEHGNLIEGVIDLVFEEAEEWIVLDYKTDRISKEEVPQRAEMYRGQMQTYAHALKALTGKNVKETILFFVRLGKTFSFYPNSANELE